MMASIVTMEGVGPAAIEVFRQAGFHTILQLRRFDRQDGQLRSAIRAVRLLHDFPEDYWKRMMTRCLNIIYRARSSEAADFIPDIYMCPITLDLYYDPVVGPSGHSYSREAIEEHLATRSTDPITREPLTIDQLYPNRALRDVVEHYRLHHQRFRILS